ncbi:SAM-dependent methyltransferase, partial [Mycobacterium kansasii]
MPGQRAGSELPLPASRRDDSAVAGHWLLARLGKRVL